MSTETLENKRSGLNPRSIELNKIIKDCEKKIEDYSARLQLLERLPILKNQRIYLRLTKTKVLRILRIG